MKHLAHREEGGVPGDQQAGRKQQIQPIRVIGEQVRVHQLKRKALKGEHRHYHQQRHDQQRLNEIGAHHGAHPSVERVNRGNADHHHHAEAVVEPGQRFEEDAGAHGLGHQKAQGVNGGDQHEHPPGGAAVAQADEVAAGAAAGHQPFDPDRKRCEQNQAQASQGVAEHAPEAVAVAEFRRQQCGVARDPGGHQGGGAQGQADVAARQHVVVGIAFAAASP